MYLPQDQIMNLLMARTWQGWQLKGVPGHLKLYIWKPQAAQPVKRTNVYLWNEQNYKGHPHTYTQDPEQCDDIDVDLDFWVHMKICAHFSTKRPWGVTSALKVLSLVSLVIVYTYKYARTTSKLLCPFWGYCQSITQLLYGM